MKMPSSIAMASPAGDAPKRRRRSRDSEPLDVRKLPIAEEALAEISDALRKLFACYEHVLREHAGDIYADERNRQEELLGINELSVRLGIRKKTISDAIRDDELDATWVPFKGGISERGKQQIRFGDACAWMAARNAKASKVSEAIPGRGPGFYAKLGSISQIDRKLQSGPRSAPQNHFSEPPQSS